ncbi:MAG: phosphoribosylformylglycinamidine synthase [Gemmatimonadetes bacterium]|nr:phosphoribosylformylglycinamidine synthase [Gemmatimonadota bacterium]
MPEILEGPPALSEFRRQALLDRCREICPAIGGLSVNLLYMVGFLEAPDGELRQRLRQVLAVGDDLPPPHISPPHLPLQPTSTPEWVTEIRIAPRPGTISPWSSKATDILHNCGLGVVSRIERAWHYRFSGARELLPAGLESVYPLLYDRMTEAVADDLDILFREVAPRALGRIPLMADGREALEGANEESGLAMSPEEINYLYEAFAGLGRDPTDVELVMFANVNSEHCRHKIFNAAWTIDGESRDHSLFDMIRHTHARHPQWTVKAYSDNSGVIEGYRASLFRAEAGDGHSYVYTDKLSHILCKVETHNHPTAISPYPGASTGVGGEIRDEGATGTGGQPQAGLCAFYTSHLRLTDFPMPWEREIAEHPSRLATPLEIMTEGPLGGAAFGNEFGRPNILGVFRTCEEVVGNRHRGYHKPIMVAGGVGLIDAEHVRKKRPQKGDLVIQLGGPAMLIGLGGGYASSMDTGSNPEDLDFASVQRDNPEMERRCQELISRCIALGADNPIRTIHDIGAGGLSNACPELVEETGAAFDLRAIHNDDPGMSPVELWSNEAQERYVLVIDRGDLARFAEMAARERCLFAPIGEVTDDGNLSLRDPLLGDDPIRDLPLEVILGKPPRMMRDVHSQRQDLPPLNLTGVDIGEAAERVLRFPAVADKTFLITIADRTVTGLIARDQMVGPFQTPIADVAVTATSFREFTGSAMAMGERTPAAIANGPASGRLAIAEAITNIAAARIGPIEKIKLSANWMCACGEEGEDARLYETVQAVGMDFCPRLGVAIPVGKDSLSMRTVWEDSRGQSHRVVAPLSLVISAFAAVEDIRATVTPDLAPDPSSRLLLLDLGRGRNRLGASCLAQVYNQLGADCADVDADDLRRLFAAVQEMVAGGLLLAYHDRSDGGLFVTLAEMAFGARCGLAADISALGEDPLAVLFAEEIGAVIQYRAADGDRVRDIIERHDLASCARELGHPTEDGRVEIVHAGHTALSRPTAALQSVWSELTFHMQAHRDHPECARQEYEARCDAHEAGMSFLVPFDVEADAFPESAPAVATKSPGVAVLREQGINGHVEMAAAFDAAGFEAVDVTMTDLLDGRVRLDSFRGLVACGGFSYGDVLGAGAGWARTILFNPGLREQFAAFFERADTFALGVCNGCQMMSLLGDLIPGTASWPRFLRNRSEQFEARLVTVEVLESNSVLFAGMTGSRLPIACAHGEGRTDFSSSYDLDRLSATSQLCMRYVDHRGEPTERYPLNPNGSPGGVTALCNTAGRVTIMMPHPERVFRNVQLSYRPSDWDDSGFSPWIRLFRNAYRFATQ